MKEDLLKIINHYGLANQLKYIHSEYYELDEAILQHEFGYFDICYIDDVLNSQIKHIAEELADIQVMLKQFQYYYDIKDGYIEEIMKEKIERQLDRIDKENKNV